MFDAWILPSRVVDPSKKVPDLNCEVQDLSLEAVDLKQEAPDLTSGHIPPQFNPWLNFFSTAIHARGRKFHLRRSPLSRPVYESSSCTSKEAYETSHNP